MSVSAGWGYTCGVYEGGGVECWRWGADGSVLYEWTTKEEGWSPDPGAESAPGGVFSSVSAGRESACGVRPGGRVECWGRNPAVSGPPGGVFESVSVGIEHACGLRADGAAECWGASRRRRPASLPPGGVFSSVAAGGNHACALGTDFRAACWGFGFTWPPPSLPAAAPGVPGGAFRSLHTAHGEHVCGIRPAGAVACWATYSEDRGDEPSVPHLAPPEGVFTHIAVGEGPYACGLRVGGRAECWSNNKDGKVRHRVITPPDEVFTSLVLTINVACGFLPEGGLLCWELRSDHEDPVKVRDEVFTEIRQGGRHVCGLAGGEAVCWNYTDPEDPAASPPGGKFASLAAGEGFTCGLRPGGRVECWGGGSFGQSSPPAGVFTAITAGYTFACGLRLNGGLECWGFSGLQSKILPPQEPLTSVSAGWGGHELYWDQGVEMDWGYSCGLRANGRAVCWGDDTYKTVPWGLLTTPPRDAFKDVQAGRRHACGLRPAGGIECWNIEHRAPREPHAGGEDYTALSVGGTHTCGLRAGGAIKCWTTDGSSSLNFQGPYTAVSAGYEHQCGVRAEGSIHCWEQQEPYPDTWKEHTYHPNP